MKKLIECIPNFSEGKKTETLEAISSAILGVPGVELLDREADPNHNRSVFTMVGEAGPVADAAFRAVAVAAGWIDLNHHQGEHPRMGACDVLPFVPLSGATMEDCVALAKQTGERIGNKLGIPVYLYEEAATRPERRNLAEIRKPQFEGLKDLIGKDPERKPDFGPSRIHATAGAIAVGARFFLIAYNVNLKTDNVALAKEIAKKIREKDGGFPKVKAMGFFLEDRKLAQVSMNLTNFTVTPILTVYEAIEREAKEKGVEILESELIGLAPQAAFPDGLAQRIRLARFDPETQIIERRIARLN